MNYSKIIMSSLYHDVNMNYSKIIMSSSSSTSSSKQYANVVINKHPSAITTEPTESQLGIFRDANDFVSMKRIIETTNIDANYFEAIVKSSSRGINEIVNLLIAAGADVNIRDEVNISINMKLVKFF